MNRRFFGRPRPTTRPWTTARVAVLLPNPPERRDGTTARAERVIPFVAAGFKTTVLTAGGGGRSGDVMFGGVPVMRFFRSKREGLLNPFKLLSRNLRLLGTLIRGSFDVVYAQGAFSLLFLPSLFVASRLGGTPFIYEAHALGHKERAQVSRLQSVLLLPMELFARSLASGVVALSREAYRFYSGHGGRTFLVPVFVDTRRFTPAGHRHNGTKRVGLVGPFDGVFNRGQLEFLISNLGKFDARISFVLIGVLGRRPGADRLSATGFLSDEEYPRELARLDALMVPATLSTLGPKNKIIEAMACGLPVFTSPEGAVGLDLARPGENVFIFPLDQMVDGVNSLIFSEAELDRVGMNARRAVEDNCSDTSCGRAIVDAIEEVLEND